MAFSWTLRPGGDPLGWYTARNNATASTALRFDSSGTGTCLSLRWPGHGPINPRREQRVLLFEWPAPHRARYAVYHPRGVSSRSGSPRKGAADIFLETERKDLVVFTPEERKRAVELYLTTSTTTAEAVEHLGHPTRRRLERRPAKDPRYVGHMAKPIIPLETRRKAIEPVSGGMRGSKPTGGSARA